MDDVTYRDPAVISLLQSKYILVKVDQDSRPDLSNRYEDYGWPATVVFNSSGGEIVRRQGYLPPKQMASMLQAIIDDPSPGPSVTADSKVTYSTTSALSPQLIAHLRASYDKQYDSEHAGWGFGHKYLDADSVEYAMYLAAHGDKQAEQRAKDSLRAERRILDPVWGGAYQYSAGGDWNEPHFEKLIGVQADTIRSYSLAYAQWHDPADLAAARATRSYVERFLKSPDGAFYVSQDADLVQGEHAASYFALNNQARLALGVPRVDTHLYARENGWMIASLTQLYAAAADPSVLAEAERAATWVITNRSLPNGGFKHAATDASGPYLGDSLAMGQAFLDLYTATGDRRWLDRAEAARRFIALKFSKPGTPGYLTAAAPTDRAYSPHPERDENVELARFANLLYQYSGAAADNAMSMKAMQYMATPEIASRPMSGGVLLAQTEFTTPPIHITVVAPRANPAAQQLFQTALKVPLTYKRIEWLDPSAGLPVRDDVHYPKLDHPAAFLCTERACSSPIFTAENLNLKIARALASNATQP